MFRKWLAIFKSNTLMHQAYNRSFQMLDITKEMFLKAKNSLRFTEDTEIEIDIYNKDIEINKYEREVRRNVLSHLSISGIGSLASGFILTSIIIDIERIGDYTKNIVELALNHPGKLSGGIFEEKLQKIEKAVEDNFTETKNCFESGNSNIASELLKKYGWVSRDCDSCLIALVKEEDKSMKTGNAVALALYFRWLKRINSHLRNVTTSVVNPFDRIGFKPKE
jgi:phosphate transport system protein